MQAQSPSLFDLRRQFHQQLPIRLAAMYEHFQRTDASLWLSEESAALHRGIHDLIGLAGTFGMQSLSYAARVTEAQVAEVVRAGIAPDETTRQTIDSSLNSLRQLALSRLDHDAETPYPPHLNARLDAAPLVHMLGNDPVQNETILRVLREAGFRTRCFKETTEFRTALKTSAAERPAAVIVDHNPEQQSKNAPTIAELDLDKECEIPIIVLSETDDLAARLAALRAGARHYLRKPVDALRLTEILEELSNRQPQQAYRVLLINDDPLQLEAHAAILRCAGMETRTSTQALRILEIMDEFAPEVVLLDVFMPEAHGSELAELLRERDHDAYFAILLTSADTDLARRVLANKPAHDGFLSVPAHPKQLIGEVTIQARRARQKNTLQQRYQASRYELEREHTTINQHAIVSIADRAGNITYVNDKFCQISGYSHDELLGQNHRIVKSGEHPPAFYQDLWQTILDGEIWQGEICNRRKDGRPYWVKTTITPFFDNQGRPYQYVSIRTDITDIKTAEQRLRLAQRALAASNSAISIVDARQADRPLIYVNPAFERITGYRQDEVLGKNCRLLQREDRDQPALVELRQALTEGRDAKVLLRNYRKNGDLFWNQLHIAPVFDESSQLTHFVGIAEDVSESLKATEALEKSEERLRRGQLYANIGTWEWDISSGQIYWSESIGPLFGLPKGDLSTRYDRFMDAIHPDDRQAVNDAINNCIENDTEYNIEHRVIWPDGTVRWLQEHGAVRRSSEGRPLQMLGVVQDIGDRKQAEQALIDARDAANRANQAKSDFLSSMSHELRTPLNAIIGFGQLMELDELLGETHRDDVREILNAGRHLLDLINDILDLAKLESGRLSLSLEPVMIGPLIEECLSLVQTLADKRQIRLRHKKLDAAVAQSDRTRLKQALLNLLSNAIKYNRDSGDVTIEVISLGEERLGIQVTDTGHGIAAERLPELFHPFNRLDAENSGVEGTGIGLTITHRIVAMMGGAVHVESEVGVGSRFLIELPQSAQPQPNYRSAPSSSLSSTAADVMPGENLVLYIEDNPSNLRLVNQILERRKHIHLLTAHTAELGIELARTRRPDLILLDINMPSMNGYQVIKVLQSELDLKTIPVVAITANAMPRDIARGKQAGFAEYLTKPLDIKQFHAVMNRFLNRNPVSPMS
ncbi:PAS domain S-box protein [Methylomarinum sp. Ch1-1]|uniref:histidine kinase n=1 Tax=Methylomarinum roseum TaxID=3067653 RepID=A0AAU7NQJ5_9GAMM|nr:PAS domain S-box protein [Methylomarinum sp. Ch1-1]MDP4521151.1 PAS domain S-box protein [Methylomarinum sp. Ch1-1]